MTKKYQYDWSKYNSKYYIFSLKFSLKNDNDIIELLKTKENKNEYIRNLIRADMEQRTL